MITAQTIRANIRNIPVSMREDLVAYLRTEADREQGLAAQYALLYAMTDDPTNRAAALVADARKQCYNELVNLFKLDLVD